MKKYNEESVKGLTKAQVIEILESEGVEFDPAEKKEALVALLLDIELKEELEDGEKDPVENPSEEVLEAEKKLGEMNSGRSADHSVFMAELARRQGSTKKVSSFQEELERRKGGKPNKRTFAEELAARLKNLRK